MELPEVLVDDSEQMETKELRKTSSIVEPESPISEQLNDVAEENVSELQSVSEENNMADVVQEPDDPQEIETENYEMGNNPSYAENLDVCEQKISLDMYNKENGTNLVFNPFKPITLEDMAMKQVEAMGLLMGINGKTDKELATNTIIEMAKMVQDFPNTAKDVGISLATGIAKTAKSTSDIFLPESMQYPEPDYQPKTGLGNLAEGVGRYGSAAAEVAAGGVKNVLGILKGQIKNPKAWKYVRAITKLAGDYLTEGIAFFKDDTNLSTMARDSGIPGVSTIGDLLAIDKDDTEAEKFFKQGAEGLGLGRATDFIFKSLKMLRHAKKTADEVADVTNHNTVIKKEVPLSKEETEKLVAEGKMIEPRENGYFNADFEQLDREARKKAKEFQQPKQQPTDIQVQMVKDVYNKKMTSEDIINKYSSYLTEEQKENIRKYLSAKDEAIKSGTMPLKKDMMKNISDNEVLTGMEKTKNEITALNKELKEQRNKALLEEKIKKVEKAKDTIDDYAAKWDIQIPRAAKKNEGEIYEAATKRVEESGYSAIESAEERLTKAKELIEQEKDIVAQSATAANVLDLEWTATRDKFNKANALFSDGVIDDKQLDDIFWDGIERMEKFDGLFKDVTSPAGQALNIASKSEGNRFINNMRKLFGKDEAAANMLESAIMSGETGREIMWSWEWAKKLTGTNTLNDAWRKLTFMRQTYLLSKPSTHVKNILGNEMEATKNKFVNPVASTIGYARRALHLGQFDDYVSMEDAARYAKTITTSTISDFAQLLRHLGPTEQMKHIYTGVSKIAIDTPEDLFVHKFGKMFAKYGPLKALTNEDMVFVSSNFKASLEEYLSRAMRKSGLDEIDGKKALEFIENKILNPDAGEELSGLIRPIKERAITNSAIAYARNKAEYNTFKSGYSATTKIITKIMNFPVLKLFWTPFSQTRTSMIVDHLIRDDIGSMFGKGWASKLGKASWGAEQDKALAKGMIVGSVGYPLLFGFTSLALNGHITGGKYTNSQKEKAFIEGGGQHHSFVWTTKDGRKKYLSLEDTGGIGDMLCLAGDIAQAQEEFSDREDLGKVFEDPSVLDYIVEAAKRTGTYAMDQVNLRTIGDIFNVYANLGENDERAMSKLAAVIADTLVPSVAQGIGKEKYGIKDRFKKERARGFYEMIANKLGVVEAVGKEMGKQPRYAYSNTGELIKADDSLLRMTTGLKYKEQSELEKIKEKGNITFPRITTVKIANDVSVPLSDDENYRLRKIMNSTGAYERINNLIMMHKDIIKLDDVKNTIQGQYNKEVERATAILLEENPDIINRGIDIRVRHIQRQFE